jgi:hypothetical protein
MRAPSRTKEELGPKPWKAIQHVSPKITDEVCTNFFGACGFFWGEYQYQEYAIGRQGDVEESDDLRLSAGNGLQWTDEDTRQ